MPEYLGYAPETETPKFNYYVEANHDKVKDRLEKGDAINNYLDESYR
jgi:hypothetical protein